MPPGKRRKIDTDHRRAHEDKEPDSHTPKRQRKDLLHSSKEYWATAAIVSENVPKRQFLIRWKGRDRDGSLWEDSWEPHENVLPETIKEWKAWKKTHRPFNKRPDSDFEKLPYPHGWHLKGSPINTQSSDHIATHLPETLSSAESATSGKLRPPKSHSRVIDSSSLQSSVDAPLERSYEPDKPFPQARVVINIANKPIDRKKRVIPDSQSQKTIAADHSPADTDAEEASAEFLTAISTPLEGSQGSLELLPPSSGLFCTEQSNPNGEVTNHETFLQPAQWASQDQTENSISGAQEDQEGRSQSVILANQSIGESFLRPKQKLAKAGLEPEDQLPAVQQPQSSSILLSPETARISSGESITETPISGTALISESQPLKNSSLHGQEQKDATYGLAEFSLHKALQTGAETSTVHSSSPPHVPSHLLEETLDSLAPPRPQTPSDVTMSARPSTRHTPSRDLLASQSPRSTGTHLSPMATAPGSQQPPSSPAVNRASLEFNLSAGMPTIRDNDRAFEHIRNSPFIQLMDEQVKWILRVTDQAFTESATVRKFADSSHDAAQDAATKQEVDSLFEVLGRIEDHADLVRPDEDNYSETVPLAQRAAWNRHASSKIVFLEAVIDQLKYSDKKIAVLSRAGPFVSKIEENLAAAGVGWIRIPGGPEKELPKSRFTVILLNGDSPRITDVLDSIDAVIDLAPTESANFISVRAKLVARLGVLDRAMISPVPFGSISYLEDESARRGMSKEMQHRIALLSFDPRADRLGKTREWCGKLPKEFMDASKHGARIGQALLKGTPSGDAALIDYQQMLAHTIVLNNSAFTDISRATSPRRQKREHDQIATSTEDAEGKKRRLIDENTSSQVPGSFTGDRGTVETEDVTQANSATHVSQSIPAVSAASRAAHAQAEAAARRQIAHERSNYAAQEEALAALQSRFEAMSTENGALRRQVAAAVTLQNAAELRMQKQQATLDTLREEKSAIKAEVEQARASLAASAVADLQELATLREQAGRVSSLEKQLASQRETNAYITQQYRAASDNAVEEASANAALREENLQLKKRADEQVLKLRELFESNTLAAVHEEIQKHMQQTRAQDRLLERLANVNEALQEKIKDLEEREEARYGMAAATRSGSRAQTPRASSLGPGQASQAHGQTKGGLAPESAALRAVLEGGSHTRGATGMSRSNSRQGSPANGGGNGIGRGQGSVPMVPSHLRD